ncbi:MAG: hypothetical protein NTZ64_16800, partial [Polaromonas sp.]|nr:hypothetical protein [Polaromonas sp.]
MQFPTQPDYPAAHSMDSCWFAIDDAGEIAQMETYETGPVPSGGARADGMFDLFHRLDKDANGIPVFPVEQDLFPEGLSTQALEHILASLPEPARQIIERLAFDKSLGADEKHQLKKSVGMDFSNFVAWLVDPADIREFELEPDMLDDEIIRLDVSKPVFHIKGNIVGVDALCLLLKKRLLAWREVDVYAGDPGSIADFYGIYVFSSSSPPSEDYSYLRNFPFPLFEPTNYDRDKVPKKPRIGLEARTMAVQSGSEQPGATFHLSTLAHHMPGVLFSEIKSIQVADFIPCYSWGEGNLLPDSGDSAMRRNLTIIHKADSAERDR